MVIPDTSVPHGTTVTVTCDSGYMIVGNSTAVCNNGVFTGVPACKRRPTLTGNMHALHFTFCIFLNHSECYPNWAFLI